ncbi:hypothetical protein [Arthrobacter antioxidans]|uniref:hypothetical protein n=1 Tax=Arthrobacter antioxidans TaxID=2895818 RepID=UPI001FFEB0CF|nr:hypothetical protein [Arthrobacter antioxidans]
MTPTSDLHPVHALSILSANSRLRERQILMVQQALHNAGALTAHERRDVLEASTGRPVESLQELRQGELGPVLGYTRTLSPRIGH